MASEQLAAHPGLMPGLARDVGSPVLARERLLPLADGFGGLFPEGGLRRGSTVQVSPGHLPGATSVALALLSGPSAAGSWCAVVGGSDLGLVAAAQLGIDLARLALIGAPGAHWAVVTAALLEGFDVVLLCISPAPEVVPAAGPPPTSPASMPRAAPSDARKLEARARERGSVLVVLGSSWPGGPEARLSVASCSWQGLENGPGYLAGRQVDVVVGGRGAASRPRRARLCLPGKPAT